MSERRYTDQEVTTLLQRAADLDRDGGATALARGLNLTELRDIASEAGIDPAMVTRAATELSATSPSRRSGLLFGKPPVVRRTAAVPGRLDAGALGRLIDVVDEEAPSQGTVAEALGSVRWTSANRFLSRQVVMQPGAEETIVRVEERFTDRFRAIVHLIPGTYAAGGGFALGASLLGGPVGSTAGAALGGLVGWGIGRSIWNAIRQRGRRRVERLADRLGEVASTRVEPGDS